MPDQHTSRRLGVLENLRDELFNFVAGEADVRTKLEGFDTSADLQESSGGRAAVSYSGGPRRSIVSLWPSCQPGEFVPDLRRMEWNYDRQLRFAGMGPVGQEKLRESRVALVGCGAIGSVIAERLVRAGVGHMQLIDRDYVEPQNLSSQSLYSEEDVRECLPKAIAAQRTLHKINSHVKIKAIVTDLNPENVEQLFQDVQLVLDGTDNFETRFVINDACVKHAIPWIYSAAVEGYGTSMTIRPRKTACLRCLFPTPPAAGTLPTCETSGVINSITGTIASIASAEALKLLVGTGTPNTGLLYIDLWENQWKLFPVRQRSECPACVLHRYDHLEAGEGAFTTALCGRNAVQLRLARPQQLDLSAIASRLRSAGAVRLSEHLLRFRASEGEMVLFPDGRAIIQGTADPTVARQFYAKYVGL